MWRKIKLSLVAGMLVLLPLYFTYAILVWLFLLIDGIFNRLATRALVSALNLPISEDQVIYGLGIVTLLIVVLVTGWLARNYFGNQLIAWFNALLDRIPLISMIYKTLRQIAEALFSDKREAFQNPVLIEYPRPGLFTLAFKTQNTGGSVQQSVGEDCISVFLPSTPNPTTGFLLFVPTSQVRKVDLSTEEALKLIISGGVITTGKGSLPSAVVMPASSAPPESPSPNKGAKE